MLSASVISSYNKSRIFTDTSIVCHAPFVNLNFNQNGNITACCCNRKDVLGVYPHNSIMEAWTSEAAAILRSSVKHNRLEEGCSNCLELLTAGNYQGAKSKTYDKYVNASWIEHLSGNSKITNQIVMPKVLEFELANTCNLECMMCSGYFSSTIRKNREYRAPLPVVYDFDFVQQLKYFIPTVTDMKFLGGEPFLIDIYYDIWEEVVKINPQIKIHITTNATVLNNKVKQLLDKLNVGIVLSIDSLNKETYEKIRTGASFGHVMENLFYFKKITKQKNTYLSIAACPMINNWKNLPQLFSFCNKQNIFLHFNIVRSPEELSLQSYSIDKLKEVIAFLESHIPTFPLFGIIAIKNKKVFTDLIKTIKYWLAEKEVHSNQTDIVQNWHITVTFEDIEHHDNLFKLILRGIIHFNLNDAYVNTNELEVDKINLNDFTNIRIFFYSLIKQFGPEKFSVSFFKVLQYIYNKSINDNPDIISFDNKISKITEMLQFVSDVNQFAFELTETPPLQQINVIKNLSIETISTDFYKKYVVH